MIMRIVVISGLLSAALIAVGCADSGERSRGAGASSGDRVTVVASFYPLAWLAERTGGKRVDVRNLTPAGAEPHDLELTPRDIAELQSADVVIYMGRGFQPALEDALKDSDAQQIDVLETPSLSLITPAAGGKVGEQQHADEGELDIDPHVWLDPNRFAAIADYVAQKLRWEGGEVSGELKSLDGEVRAGLAECERRELFTSHAAFGYLADRYDLDQVAITGLSPEAEPLPRDLERVGDRARTAGATTIFFETLVSPKLSEQIADEVGAQTAVLDPLEGIAQDRLAAGVDYLAVMRENLAALQKGLGCATS